MRRLLAVRILAALIFASAIAASGVAITRADPAPVVSPSATPSAQPSISPEDFLALPAKDATIENPSPRIRVGDRILLKIEGADRPGAYVALPPLIDEGKLREQGFAILDDGKKPVGAAPAQPTGTTIHVQIVPILPGEHTLPSLAIADPAAGGAFFARMNPVTVQVESTIRKSDPKPHDPAPLQGPVSLPFPTELLAGLITLAVALLAAGGLLLAKWLAKRAARAIRAAIPRKPEDVEALQKLEALERAGFAQRGEFKKHYFGISEALKVYIGRRWEFDAPERTSDEILRHLRSRAFAADLQISRLQDLFERLDLIKFTDTVPALSDAVKALEDARIWVNETRKPPQLATEGKPNALR